MAVAGDQPHAVAVALDPHISPEIREKLKEFDPEIRKGVLDVADRK
jgi:hypothetical protein